MAIGSGLAHQLGFKAGSTWDTAVTVDHFVEPNSVQLTKAKNTAQGEGLYAGKLQNRSARRVVTTNAAEGTIELDVVDKGLGLFYQALMGSTATPSNLSGSAYSATHTLADNFGKFLTIQTGVPLTSGTVQPYTVPSAKVFSAEFSCGVDEILTASFGIRGSSMTEVPTLASASYTASLRPFNFADAVIKIGTLASEASISGVKKVTVKIERPIDDTRFYYGALGVAAEPIINGATQITASIEFDYINKTYFADRFAADTSTAMIVEFAAPTAITGSYYPLIRFNLPLVYFDTGTPTVEGENVVNTTVEAVSLYNGTDLPSIYTVSTDSTH